MGLDPSARRLIPFFVYTVFSRSDVTRSLFVIYLLQIGLSSGQIGVLQGTLFLGSLLVEIPTGLLADRIGRKRVILIGHACLILMGLGFLISHSFWHFLIVFLLWGVGTSHLSGAEEALLYETNPRKVDFTRVLGWLRALSSISLAVSFFVGGQLLIFGWATVFLAYVVSKALAAIIVLTIPETLAGRTQQSSKPALMSVFPFFGNVTDRTPVSARATLDAAMVKTLDPKMLNVIGFLRTAGKWLIVPMVAVALLDAAVTPFYIFGQTMFRLDGLTPVHIGGAYAVMEILASLSCLSGNMLQRKLGLRPSLCLGLVLVGLILILNRIISGPVAGLIFVATAVTIPQGVYVVFESYLQEEAPDKLRASIFSVYSFAVFLAIAVAYVVYGQAVQHLGVRSAGVVLSILPAIGLIMVITLKRRDSSFGENQG